MEFYLMKQLEYKENTNEFGYVPIKEVDFTTNSRELMIYDKKSNNIWYSFLFTPDAHLTKIKKENIEEQLEMISKERMENEKIESFHKVSEEIFFQYLNFLAKRFQGNKKESSLKDLIKIIEKIKSIKLKYS